MRKKTTGRTRQPRRKDRRAGRSFGIILLIIFLCFGAYWLHERQTNDEKQAETKMEQLDTGRDDGKDAVYTEASQELSDAVTDWLKSQDAEVEEIKREDRTEERKATGGTIYWTTRSAVVVPASEFSRDDLEKALQKSGGKAVLYRVTPTSLGGKDVTEYDIAYYTTLDGDPLYLVTDRLFVTKPKEKGGLVENIKEIFKETPADDERKETPSPAVKEEETAAPAQDSPAEVKGRLAIVIDDCGNDLDTLSVLNSVPIPLTYAVMPNKAYTAESARSGYDAGRKIFVHLPMEPLNTTSSEEIYIGGDMSDSKIQATAGELLDQVPHAVGMNNHQGSMATADARIMKSVMTVMKRRGLAFLDSRTNSASIGEQTASAMGVLSGRNNLFIDNDADVAAIKERLRQGGRIARRNGSAVVIGHCRPNTARAIREMVGELHGEGIDFVFATDLMH